jgi:hypothetical protein
MNIKKVLLFSLSLNVFIPLHAQLKITDKMSTEFSCYGTECRNLSHAEKEDLAQLIAKAVKRESVLSEIVLLSEHAAEIEFVQPAELNLNLVNIQKPLAQVPVRIYNEDYEYLKTGPIPVKGSNLELVRTDTLMSFRYKANGKNLYSSANVLMEKTNLPNSSPRAMFSTVGIGRMIQGGTIIEVSMLKSIAKMQTDGFNPKPDGFYLQIRKSLK